MESKLRRNLIMNEEMMKMMNGMGGAFMGDLDGFKEIISDAVKDALDERNMGVEIEQLEDLKECNERQEETIEYLEEVIVELEENLDIKHDIITEIKKRNKELEEELALHETSYDYDDDVRPDDTLVEEDEMEEELKELMKMMSKFKKLMNA